ncbi:hypothetical protein [Micromonospora zhanjiangensis]|uniref:PAS domain-containing protein n=1 Tax=Micromonospora zhanjiangensis TaxID=1522057 RepID=A0ABV8KKP6_9ACTN
MAHLELSLSDAFVPAATPPPGPDSLARWIATVTGAPEPCLVIDQRTRIVAISQACCDLICLGSPEDTVGRPLLDAGVRLIDFTAARGELAEQDIDKIPPLLALSSGRLARGLLRVSGKPAGATTATVDAIATPLFSDGSVAGSLTFLSEV